MGQRATWTLAVVGVWLIYFLYLLSPLDLLPDFLPILGLGDDLFGLLIAAGLTAFFLHKPITRFRSDPPTAAAVYEPIPVDEIRNW